MEGKYTPPLPLGYANGKLVDCEGLKLGEEEVRAMKPKDTNKFLDIEEGEGIAKNVVLAHNVEEMDQRLEKLLAQELNERNPIKAINARVLHVIANTMNVCTFTTGELNELHMTVKRALRRRRMHGPRFSDERLYFAKGARWKRTQELSRHV